MSSTRGEVVGYIGGKVEVKEERNIQKKSTSHLSCDIIKITLLRICAGFC
jgi:hypothetical protein